MNKEESMKKHLLIALIALGLGLGLTLMVSTPSMAVHKGSGDLQCGNCHTMHSSQGGTSGASMGGGSGSFILFVILCTAVKAAQVALQWVAEVAALSC